MTDNDTIKALECCANSDGCENCPYSKQCDGVEHIQYALDLINRQKAEIEMLRKKLSLADDCLDKISDASESIYSNEYTMTFIEEYYDHLTELTEKEGE